MRLIRKFSQILLMLALFTSAAMAMASTYDEGINGDLSGDRMTPTAFAVMTGTNVLTATSVRDDVEYVSLAVPAGTELTRLTLNAYTSTDKVAFAAVQNGTTFTEPPTNTTIANLLGYSHFGSDHLATNILDDLAGGAGAIGFSDVLSSGTYTFWLQQTGTATTTYTLEFLISALLTNGAYDEATAGDLSGDRFNPTPLSLKVGNNVITSSTVKTDVDYVTVTVPKDAFLTSVMLQAYTSTDQVAFVAVQTGTIFTESTTNTVRANLLGYSHFGTNASGENQLGTNILDNIGQGDGAIGFTGSLPSETYTFWLQQTGTAPTTYTLNFVIRETTRIFLPIIVKS